MWIHLGGSYWQRASWDAIIVLATGFALIAFAPSLKKFRPRHWLTGIALLLAGAIFFFMLVKSFHYAGQKLAPKIHQIESSAPH
jgi:dipeptide/tripeptide permease